MRTVLLFLALLALATPIDAEACTPSTHEPEVDTDSTAAGRHYVVHDGPCQPSSGCPPSLIPIWIYEESNGIDGLQRQDEIVDDTCGGRIPGDTVIF